MKSLMKIFFTIIVVVTILQGCNSEVFISDFAPSSDEIILSEKNSVSEISFESSNWDIQSVVYRDELGNYCEFTGNIYGPDGNLIAENSSLCTKGLEYVKMTILHPFIRLSIERKDDKHLVLSKSENMYYSTKRIYFYVGNTYTKRIISVGIEPSTRYKFDSIAYTDSYVYKDSIVQKTFEWSFRNSTNNVDTFNIHPYHDFKADYSFLNKHEWGEVLTEEQLKIFGKDTLMVPVPVIGRYGSLVMSDITLPLTAAIHNLPISYEMLKIKEPVNVNPNKQRTFIIKCWYKYYGIWFKIYASHPITHEKRTLEGLLDIYYPQSYEIEYGEETDIY